VAFSFDQFLQGLPARFKVELIIVSKLFFQLIDSVLALESFVFTVLVAEPLDEVLEDFLSITLFNGSEPGLSLELLTYVEKATQVVQLSALLLEELDKVEPCLLLFLSQFFLLRVFQLENVVLEGLLPVCHCPEYFNTLIVLHDPIDILPFPSDSDAQI
jgi:hypothetical protein